MAKTKAKSRRQLLADNRELSTKLSYRDTTIKNLEATIYEYKDKNKSLEADLRDTKEGADRVVSELRISLSKLHGHLEAVLLELFTFMRTSMRKEGMAFEDIERIIESRPQRTSIVAGNRDTYGDDNCFGMRRR